MLAIKINNYVELAEEIKQQWQMRLIYFSH
jgi:hypothetical protein